MKTIVTNTLIVLICVGVHHTASGDETRTVGYDNATGRSFSFAAVPASFEDGRQSYPGADDVASLAPHYVDPWQGTAWQGYCKDRGNEFRGTMFNSGARHQIVQVGAKRQLVIERPGCCDACETRPSNSCTQQLNGFGLFIFVKLPQLHRKAVNCICRQDTCGSVDPSEDPYPRLGPPSPPIDETDDSPNQAPPNPRRVLPPRNTVPPAPASGRRKASFDPSEGPEIAVSSRARRASTESLFAAPRMSQLSETERETATQFAAMLEQKSAQLVSSATSKSVPASVQSVVDDLDFDVAGSATKGAPQSSQENITATEADGGWQFAALADLSGKLQTNRVVASDLAWQRDTTKVDLALPLRVETQIGTRPETVTQEVSDRSVLRFRD